MDGDLLVVSDFHDNEANSSLLILRHKLFNFVEARGFPARCSFSLATFINCAVGMSGVQGSGAAAEDVSSVAAEVRSSTDAEDVYSVAAESMWSNFGIIFDKTIDAVV